MMKGHITEQVKEAGVMKLFRTGLVLLVSLCILLGAAGSCAETYIDYYVSAGGQIPDQTVYQGYWSHIYLQVLEAHSYKIHTYQAIPFEWDGEDSRLLPCFPVGLKDLNADGVPELIFMEADGDRGDLYIYSANGSTGQCVLYLPGLTRLDYDATMGFEIYLLGGNMLAIRHYRYEEEYLLQFFVNREGPYTLFDYMYSVPDASGEGDGWYYRNGREISLDAYYSILDTWNAGGDCISEYFAKNDMSYGFDYTYETAVTVLNETPEPEPQPTQQSGGAVYGLTIDKLATRKGPGTQYDGGGTYSVKGQYIQVLAKAYDGRNGIWWVKCVIPYKGEDRILWTGWKRFDHSTISLDDLPEEVW